LRKTGSDGKFFPNHKQMFFTERQGKMYEIAIKIKENGKKIVKMQDIS